ncbi:unnamed protein product [Coffea canephora]|uniref:Uncharacterized protein n=1 Tax=Coffea canephora TaxID=49390 RepID=A0A068VCA1_COFCA|nr:unnamed protein product [Coffea canephora]
MHIHEMLSEGGLYCLRVPEELICVEMA